MSSGKRKQAPAISPVMRALATYISRALGKKLPAPVHEKTKHHVLDTLAAMVSGSRLLPGRKAISYIEPTLCPGRHRCYQVCKFGAIQSREESPVFGFDTV